MKRGVAFDISISKLGINSIHRAEANEASMR